MSDSNHVAVGCCLRPNGRKTRQEGAAMRKMRRMLQYQANRIEAILEQHNVSGRVTGGTVTPRWVRFQVLPIIGARLSHVKDLEEELGAALGATSCRVARQGEAVVIEVARDDPRPVRLKVLVRSLRAVPPVTAILGLDDDGVPLLIRLPSPDVAHVLVAGITGSGKTTLLRSMILSLALRHPHPRELGLVLVGEELSDLAGLPQVRRAVLGDTGEALASLVRLMEYRKQEAIGRPPVMLFIDQLSDPMMLCGREAEQQLTHLVQRGHEAGIHVVAATQKPAVAEFGSLVKTNFPVRLVGKVASACDAQVASGWPGTGAERLLGRGDFFVVADGRVSRFHAAYISQQDAAELVAGLRDTAQTSMKMLGSATEGAEPVTRVFGQHVSPVSRHPNDVHSLVEAQ